MNYKQFIHLLQEENTNEKNKEYYYIQLNILEFLKFLNNESIDIDKFYSLEKNQEPLNVSLDTPVFIYLLDISDLLGLNSEVPSSSEETSPKPIPNNKEEPNNHDKDIPIKNQSITINFLKDVISSIEVDSRFYPIVSHFYNNNEISEEAIIEYLQIPKDKSSRKEIQDIIKTFIEDKLEEYPFDAKFV